MTSDHPNLFLSLVKQALDEPEFGFDAAVVGSVLCQQSVVVGAVVEFGNVLGLEVLVVGFASPGHKVLSGLQVGSPSLFKEVVVVSLEGESHSSFLLKSGGIEVVSHISHKISPLL